MDALDFYSFLRDPKLLELIELNKTSDDIFDVITLNENQNSQVLAWCMNPNEGHAQGDAMIRDFLEAACSASEGCTWDNKKFFSKWTLGRIRTTSFGAAFVTREFSIKVNGGSGNGRLDLFLVDPQNKLLITIENKVSASLNAAQLEKYVQAVKSELASRKAFADYDLAFIVIDKDLDAYSAEHLETLGTRWALMDYKWLEFSANRARHNLSRGNQAAQMLAAYCQSVTNWESPGSKEQSDLMADLAITYPAVIECMRELNGHAMNKWVSSTLSGHLGELIIFLAQHRAVCEKLINIRGIASIAPKLKKSAPMLTSDCIEEGSYWISAMPPIASTIQRGERWPIYIDLYKVAKVSTPSAPKFNVKLVWVKSEFDPLACTESLLREHFEAKFRGLNKRVTSDRRRITIAEHVSPTEAVAAAAHTVSTLEKELQELLKKSSAA